MCRHVHVVSCMHRSKCRCPAYTPLDHPGTFFQPTVTDGRVCLDAEDGAAAMMTVTVGKERVTWWSLFPIPESSNFLCRSQMDVDETSKQ